MKKHSQKTAKNGDGFTSLKNVRVAMTSDAKSQANKPSIRLRKKESNALGSNTPKSLTSSPDEKKFKLNHPCDICKKELFLNENIARLANEFFHTECLIKISADVFLERNHYKSKCVEFIKRLQELKSQFCTPNKPMNTFQYARELEEEINELIKEVKGK